MSKLFKHKLATVATMIFYIADLIKSQSYFQFDFSLALAFIVASIIFVVIYYLVIRGAIELIDLIGFK